MRTIEKSNFKNFVNLNQPEPTEAIKWKKQLTEKVYRLPSRSAELCVRRQVVLAKKCVIAVISRKKTYSSTSHSYISIMDSYRFPPSPQSFPPWNYW